MPNVGAWSIRDRFEAMAKSAPLVEKLAALEGLDAHARSATIRVGR